MGASVINVYDTNDDSEINADDDREDTDDDFPLVLTLVSNNNILLKVICYNVVFIH